MSGLEFVGIVLESRFRALMRVEWVEVSGLCVRLSGKGIKDNCGALGFDFDVGIPFLMLIIKRFLMVFIGLRFVDPSIDLAIPSHESNGP